MLPLRAVKVLDVHKQHGLDTHGWVIASTPALPNTDLSLHQRMSREGM